MGHVPCNQNRKQLGRVPFFRIKKNVVVLGAVSFFTDIASEMLYPIIPIFLTSVLGAPMSIVGLIEGIAESTASVLKAVSGWFSDRIKKRIPFVAAGYSLSAISKPLLALAYSWPVVLIARFVDRFGKGIRVSARDALIAYSTEQADRGRAFGFHRAMDTAGAVIGPLLAILLIKIFDGNLRPIFMLAFIPGAIAVAIIFIFLRSEPSFKPISGGPIKFNLAQFSPEFKKFLLISSIFAIGNSSDAFLILRAKDVGFAMTSIILAYVTYNISYSLFSLPAGVLSDKVTRKRVLILGYMIFAFVYFGFGIARTKTAIWGLFLIYGFYMAMTDGISKAFVADLVEQEKRGTALGIFHCAIGILGFFASLIAGLLWTAFGAPAPFLYGSITAVISCLAFLTLFRK